MKIQSQRCKWLFLSVLGFSTACGGPENWDPEFGSDEQAGLNAETGYYGMSKSIGMYKGNTNGTYTGWSADCTATLIGRDGSGNGCYLTAGHCSTDISGTKKFAYSSSNSCNLALRNSSCTANDATYWTNGQWATISNSATISTTKGSEDFMVFKVSLNTAGSTVYGGPTGASAYSGTGQVHSVDWETTSTGYNNYPDSAGPMVEYCDTNSMSFTSGTASLSLSGSCSSSGQNSGGPFLSGTTIHGLWSNTGTFNSAIFQRGHIAALMRGTLGCTSETQWPSFCDINKDIKIDLTDFHTMKTNSGTSGTFTQGNCDGSGTVDSTDYGLLKANFGA